MESTQFEAFTAGLAGSLEPRSEILALVLLGTTARSEFRDEWSEHDFWVVTRPGYQDTLLNDLSWLPRPDVAANFLERSWPEYPKADADAVRRLLLANGYRNQ